MHSDDPLPGPRMSTRIVTIVAAFLVFALAISVFAIPALRVGNEAAGQGSVLLPLWPAQTSDQLEQLQANPPAWALDPQQLAQQFGQEVMGWRAASAVDAACDLPAYASSSPSYSSPSGTSYTFGEGCSSIVQWQLSTASPDYPHPYSSDSPSPEEDGAFRSYAIYPYDPPYDPLNPPWLGQPPEFVQVYQPLEQGDGQIWAVLQAQGQETLSVSPGQVVHDGSSVSAGFFIGDKYVPTLGYGSCGQSNASSAYDAPLITGAAGIQVDVHLTGGCEGAQPGYVWAATSNVSLADTGEGIVDPFAGGRPALASITAAPVTMIFPSADAQMTAPTSPTPEKSVSPAEPTSWRTYTDPLGWTIDVPDGWRTEPIDTVDRNTQKGAMFSGQSSGDLLEVSVFLETVDIFIPPTNDSQYPLDPGGLRNAQGVASIEFRGDGLGFNLSARGQLDEAQMAIVNHMVASIQFRPWQQGESRNGWIALTPTDNDPPPMQQSKISWQGCDGKGCYVLVYSGNSPYLLGPIATCGEGENMTADPASQFSIVLECPNDPTQRWTDSGEPSTTNRPENANQLDKHPVISSWDGLWLTDYQMTIGP